MTATPGRAARYESDRTCVHCGEPLVRLLVSNRAAMEASRWLHTPNRLECVNRWGEATGMEAKAADVLPPLVDREFLARNLPAARLRGRRR
ncbi:hypothetical protein ABT336_14525 [Micromonospora sp. NPDC000207]|uniref:hypothetical protein n=1 Tax=Micromonospora sp. NPDC000207 TaxID=3154246 RepID=UPI003322FC99